MERVNRILEYPKYINYLKLNEEAEHDRQYCHHDFEHLLAVARLTWMMIMEAGWAEIVPREVVYAAAFLHDLGRWKQYKEGGDHAIYSAGFAKPLLQEAGFSDDETSLILAAIKEHRDKNKPGRSPLSRALADADQFSRICFRCQARDSCYSIETEPHRDGIIY